MLLKLRGTSWGSKQISYALNGNRIVYSIPCYDAFESRLFGSTVEFELYLPQAHHLYELSRHNTPLPGKKSSYALGDIRIPRLTLSTEKTDYRTSLRVIEQEQEMK